MRRLCFLLKNNIEELLSDDALTAGIPDLIEKEVMLRKRVKWL
jgi:hypothetical protein